MIDCQRWMQAVLLVAVLGQRAHGQAATDQGAIAILMRQDTVVIDRFQWMADTLRGTVSVKGQPRIDYLAVLGPNNVVRSLNLAIFAAGAPADAAALQRVRMVVQGDTVLAETPAGVSRIGSKAGAIPMFNNALVLSELFTRRARDAEGSADIPYFAVVGGSTIMAAVRQVGADSMTLSVASQTQRLRVDAAGRILGGVIAGTPLTFVRLGASSAQGMFVTLHDASVAPRPDYSAPADAPYVAVEVHVKGPSGVLGGTLTRPRGTVRVPAVVTITGSGQQDRDEYISFAGGVRLFRQVADTLGRRGIAVLRLDDRGIGESGGYKEDQTSADFADDIRAAIAYLRTRTDIDPDRIGVVGHSEGGLIAPMIAATDPRLKAIVVMAGPGEVPIEISIAQNRWNLDHDATLSAAKKDSLLQSVRLSLQPARQANAWTRFWMGYDPAPAARKVKAATLILQGETDRQVPADQASKLAKLIRAGGNRKVTVKLIPNTNHLFVYDTSGDFNAYSKLKTNVIAPDVLGPLADWLVANLLRR